MSLYDNLFGDAREEHRVRNGIITFAILYVIIKGFREGWLTWPRIFLVVFVMYVFGKIMGLILGIPSPN